jgi:uncharacterized OB-fold protein
MTPGVPVSRCGSCGTGYFPIRLICPRCSSDDFRVDPVLEGTVEQTTMIRHAAGHAEWTPPHLATVRTTDGQVVIAKVDAALAHGTRVKLFHDGGMLFAR